MSEASCGAEAPVGTAAPEQPGLCMQIGKREIPGTHPSPVPKPDVPGVRSPPGVRVPATGPGGLLSSLAHMMSQKTPSMTPSLDSERPP